MTDAPDRQSFAAFERKQELEAKRLRREESLAMCDGDREFRDALIESLKQLAFDSKTAEVVDLGQQVPIGELETDSQTKKRNPDPGSGEQFRRSGEPQDHQCTGPSSGGTSADGQTVPEQAGQAEVGPTSPASYRAAGTDGALASGSREEICSGERAGRPAFVSGGIGSLAQDSGVVNADGEDSKAAIDGGQVGGVTSRERPA